MRLAEAWRVALDALRANRLAQRTDHARRGHRGGRRRGTGRHRHRRQGGGRVAGRGARLQPASWWSRVRCPSATRPRSPPLTLSDVDAVAKLRGGRDRVAVTLSSGETVRAGNVKQFASVLGVLGDHAEGVRPHAQPGQLPQQVRCGTPVAGVAVLGYGVARKLFRRPRPDRPADGCGRRPVPGDRRIREAGREPRRRPGRRGAHPDHRGPADVRHATGGRHGRQATQSDQIAALGDRIVAELSRRHPGTQFSAVTQDQILGVLGQILGVLTGVLAAIAGISLLVGGVGVSNIMLVSVRERTREIGLRKAVGARPRDIVLQFLLEAVLLTAIGGLTGIALASGRRCSWRLCRRYRRRSPGGDHIGIGVSAGVGILFGVVPAQRAGRLDPVVSLRTE